MKRYRRTKIIATIGPASSEPAQLEKLDSSAPLREEKFVSDQRSLSNKNYIFIAESPLTAPLMF